MSRNGWAAVFSVLVVFSIVMAAYSTLALPEIVPFYSDDLTIPDDFTAPSLPVPPSNIAGNTTARPDILVRILIGQIFEDYGGSVRMEITNNDTRALFLEEIAFDWVGLDIGSSVLLNRRLGSKEMYTVSALAVDGPPEPGIQEYRLSMRLLQYRNSRWYRMTSGGDDWISFTEQSIDVQPLGDAGENRVIYNSRIYYSRVNALVDFSSGAVAGAADNATAELPSGYNMGRVCGVFDWLVANVNYTEDPGGGDVWYSPDETLETMAGDCEDYAMLLAAMVQSIGGQSRIYLTRDHAFAAVFIGNSPSDLDNATASVHGYYGTPVPVHAFADEGGYWLVADPLGSFYLGGLAVGQEPFGDPADYWQSSFPESGSIHSLDVTGISHEYLFWLDPMMWTALIIIFGALALGFLYSGWHEYDAGVCPVCSEKIGEDIYICPGCQSSYHRRCAFSGPACPRCGSPILFPPPPPPYAP